MTTPEVGAGQVWDAGAPYERYVGRWSRLAAAEFVPWLAIQRGAALLDVGCGTGALTEAVAELSAPGTVAAVEPSTGFAEVSGRAGGRRRVDRARRRAWAVSGRRA